MRHEHWTLRSADGLPLFAQSWCPDMGTSPIICLVHGIGEHSSRYARMGARFAEAGVGLWTMDLRGHGHSGGPRGHLPALPVVLNDLDLLLDLARAHGGAAPLVLYGHSLGGALALGYALERPGALAGLIATGSWLRLAATPPRWRVGLAQVMARLWPRFSQSMGLRGDAMTHDAAWTEARRADPLIHDRITAATYVTVERVVRAVFDGAQRIDTPLLLMHGGADTVTSPQGTAELATRIGALATLRIWEGLRHELHNELLREEVYRAVLDWVRAECRRGSPAPV